jgi:hypothetical protein
LKITPDKWKHLWVGVAMGLVLQALAWWLLPISLLAISIIVLIIIIAISYGFELFSKFTGHGHHEVLDAVFSVIGGVIGMGLVVLGGSIS